MKSLYSKFLYTVILGLSLTSCKKYLNVTPDNVGTIDYAFRNRNEAENYLFSCYSTLQKMQEPWMDAGFATSGELVFPGPKEIDDTQSINAVGFNMMRGTQTSGTPGLNYWDGNEGGQALFQAIRRCNTMLENIDKPIDLGESEKKRWIAEVKFLKAYYHFYLFRMYGPIPITNVNLPINSSIEETRVKRNPVDSVVNYMVRLIDEATPNLPNQIQNQAQELGRITGLIARSVKAQILVTAASPLFNGNSDYTGFTNKDGQVLFSQEKDPKKWDRAAEACSVALNACLASGLKLHTFTPTANMPANLPQELVNVLTFQTAITEKWELNTELIWGMAPNFGFGRQERFIPRLTAASALNIGSAQGFFAVPIAEQELFYTNNGLPIDEDKTWDYRNRYTLKTGTSEDQYHVHNGYETVKAHFKREPRFYASIAFDGGVWYGNGQLSDPANANYIQARGTTSYAGPKDQSHTNISGYWPKKLVNYLTVYNDRLTYENFHFPLMRLSDLYLLYAEALNEQGKSYGEILPYIDEVRKRAKIPTVTEAWTAQLSTTPSKYANQVGLRQIIHQERRIELAFECIPGWDLRRWKELQTVMTKPMQGWSIYDDQALNYYRPRNLFVPVFNTKDYLWPIKADNLAVNPNLVQNPFW
ncbi:RagB/SusD family nutrient uptake outer membrane protein [Pedobacter hiemivivus]|uniref:RagB/SusD family nutrient uptake outer membrane protein n=1 Tax=Pedobacter hiemivivus TaxID=2530454 RepID=A0A4R0NH13_9SPHI|nr:RagB/SusD family nutrient uptake outer membrane protein [Pedobacter hiemivivus]TCC98582.1 RagB/SusD family nutrient uptake outer membrane protein [Pedobacter hiemivivus]